MGPPEPELLPKCPGPKLGPYMGDLMSSRVEFLGLLTVDSAHGIIVQAKINRRLHAVKFFVSEEKLEDERYDQVYGDRDPWKCSQALDWHFTPFENECRAFGRLKEKKVEHLAVKVHGWVCLTVDQIDQKLKASAFDGRVNDLFEEPLSPGQSLYGIVKDWVHMLPYHDQMNQRRHDQVAMVTQFPQMLHNLHRLHFNGIVVRDLKPDQYINGTLVDLSLACTVPHPFGPNPALKKNKWQPMWTFESMAAWDLYSFQLYIIEHWDKEQRNFFFNTPRNGVPKECKLEAYPAREARHRAGSNLYLPILNYSKDLAMVKKPIHDPLLFLARNRKSARQTASFPVGTADLDDFLSGELEKRVKRESEQGSTPTDTETSNETPDNKKRLETTVRGTKYVRDDGAGGARKRREGHELDFGCTFDSGR